jgi:anti-sigma regulatory factor (Ser/Thr protein kinase)
VSDDIAVMTVGLGERFSDVDAPAMFRWSSDALSASEATRIRQSIVAALQAAQLGRRDVLDAELVFSELIGNVERHAAGPLSVLLDLSRRKPVLHVLDRGPTFRFEASLPTDALSETGRGLYLISRLASEFSVSERIGGGTHARVVLANRLYHRTPTTARASELR